MTGMNPDATSIELGRLPNVRMSFHLMGLHVRKADSRWTYPSHEHAMYELHWIIDGTMQMVIDGQVFEQRKEDLLLIRPGVTHSCKSSGEDGFTYFCVHFSVSDPAFSKELDRHKTVWYEASSPLVKQLAPSLKALYNLAIVNKDETLSTSMSMKVYAAVFELLGAMLEQLSQQITILPTRKEMIAGRIAKQIEDSVHGVLLHGQTDDSARAWVHDIAKSLKMSTSQVNRIFQQVYGKAPRKYMSEILLNEAKRLLAQADLSVDYIAMMLGYKTTAHFSRQFKRWTSMTPTEYRSLAEREPFNF